MEHREQPDRPVAGQPDRQTTEQAPNLARQLPPHAQPSEERGTRLAAGKATARGSQGAGEAQEPPREEYRPDTDPNVRNEEDQP
jgi:hypothetical protein